ncbi:MAG: OmpA family protein [Roseomonas sp.]|nr:OmpA family protein [Roseomonas sp.]MCA3405977.1 OmpA family protein [Roseomonas sp.]
MSFKKTLLAAAAVVALPVLAQAQPVNGLYLGAGFGTNRLMETDVTFKGGNNTNDFSWGYVGVLSLGWGFGNGFRVELEGNYRSNDVTDVKLGGSLKGPGATGTVTSYGAMANILYDINLGGMLGGLTPYVGVGAGYIWHDYDSVGISQAGSSDTYSGTEGAFGGQAIVGLSLPISAVPGLSLTAEYRFMATSSPEIGVTNTAKIAGVGSASQKVDIEVDNFNHSLLVGLRYAFNAAPAVAAAAPVSAARTFLVFFDWSKADLTDRARQIIGEAASSRGAGVTRIEVNGFTDRSGPADYNMGLSQRRANAVAAELVRRGVPRNEIVTRGFGEENNLVPTADGVREPQNRRVEIILR